MIRQIVSTPETLDLALETWYVQNVLLDGIPYSLNVRGGIRDSTVVYIELRELKIDLIRQIKAGGNRVMLYHMGDEQGTCDISAYAECDLVVRNYYFPRIIDDPQYAGKVLWAPNGYRNGVGPRGSAAVRPARERQCLAMFSGWISNEASYGNERALFAAAAPKCGGDLYFRPSIGFGAGYTAGLYSSMMEDSVFAPCPAGNSPETIRLYDALEVGCIPVSLSHAFLASDQALASIGPVPFPLIGSWDELPAFLARMKTQMAEDPEAIFDMQDRCIDWWTSYKQHVRQKIMQRCAAPDAQKSEPASRSFLQRLLQK